MDDALNLHCNIHRGVIAKVVTTIGTTNVH